MYVIAARYRTKAGEEDKVAEFLAKMAALSNSDAEPGCVLYAINQSVDDPRAFLLYEQYVDEAAFQLHTQTTHFKELVLDGAVPLVEHRERETYNLIAP